MEPMADASTVEQRLLNQARAFKIPANGSMELLPLCNLNCKMCYVRLSRAEMEAQGRMRTYEEWIEVGRQMQKAGVLFLLLTGGEPLIYPGFRELFVALKKMGMILTINTNGTLIDEEWADFFAKNKPRRINITLYGASDETYRDLCRAPQGYQKVLDGVRLLKERGVDVKISGSATRSNQAEIREIIRLGHELGVPVVVDTYMMPGVRERNLPYDYQSRLNPEEAAAVRVLALEAEMEKDTFIAYRKRNLEMIDNFVPGTEREEPIGCMAGNCSFTINWKGEMQPCVMLTSPSANVFEVGFDAAWKHVMESAKQLHTNARCSVCRLRPLCRTCVASGLLEEGSHDAVPEYMCRYAAETERLLRKMEMDHE